MPYTVDAGARCAVSSRYRVQCVLASGHMSHHVTPGGGHFTEQGGSTLVPRLDPAKPWLAAGQHVYGDYLANMYGDYLANMYWGAPIFAVDPAKTPPSTHREDALRYAYSADNYFVQAAHNPFAQVGQPQRCPYTPVSGPMKGQQCRLPVGHPGEFHDCGTAQPQQCPARMNAANACTGQRNSVQCEQRTGHAGDHANVFIGRTWSDPKPVTPTAGQVPLGGGPIAAVDRDSGKVVATSYTVSDLLNRINAKYDNDAAVTMEQAVRALEKRLDNLGQSDLVTGKQLAAALDEKTRKDDRTWDTRRVEVVDTMARRDDALSRRLDDYNLRVTQLLKRLTDVEQQAKSSAETVQRLEQAAPMSALDRWDENTLEPPRDGIYMDCERFVWDFLDGEWGYTGRGGVTRYEVDSWAELARRAKGGSGIADFPWKRA